MTAPDPAALLAAMEAAAHNMQPKYMLMTIRPDDLAALCAAPPRVAGARGGCGGGVGGCRSV
jgi:hypothetical protein